MARVNAARDIFRALPGIWTKSLTEELLAPKIAWTPLQPSRPIVAISMTLRFCRTKSRGRSGRACAPGVAAPRM